MTIFLPKYPLKDGLTYKVGFIYLNLVKDSLNVKTRSKLLNFKKIGQIGALGKFNSEGLEPPNIRKNWSLQFGNMGVPR